MVEHASDPHGAPQSVSVAQPPVDGPIKAVVFDLGDTLVEYEGVPLNWESHYPEALRALGALLERQLNEEQLAAAAAVLRSYNTRLHPRTHEVRFETILTELLPHLHSRPARIDQRLAARAFFSVFRQKLRCFPDALPCLSALRRAHLKLGIFTDVPYGMPTELVHEDIAAAGLSGGFDVIGTSLEAGYRKPSPLTLAAIAARLGCAAAEIVHVGNERKDVDVARAFGCRAVVVQRTAVSTTWGQDHTVGSLNDLLCVIATSSSVDSRTTNSR